MFLIRWIGALLQAVGHWQEYTKVECWFCGRMFQIARSIVRRQPPGFDGYECGPCGHMREAGEAYDREMEDRLMEWERAAARFREIPRDPAEVERELNALWVEPGQELDEVEMYHDRCARLDRRLRNDDLFVTHDQCCELNLWGHGELDTFEDQHAPDPTRYAEPVDSRTWSAMRDITPVMAGSGGWHDDHLAIILQRGERTVRPNPTWDEVRPR